MTIVGAIVTFLVSWWLFLFMVLPFGVQPQDDPVAGTDPGAPGKPRLVIKIVAATILAAASTYALALFIDSGMIDLRPAAAQVTRPDLDRQARVCRLLLCAAPRECMA